MSKKSNKNEYQLNTYFVFNNSIVFLDPWLIFVNNLLKKGLKINQIARLETSFFPKNIKPNIYDLKHLENKSRFYQKYYIHNSPNKERFKSLKIRDIEFNLANLKQITFEVTDACNLNCHYCGYGDFYWNHDRRENLRLNFKLAKKILDYLIKFWNSDLNTSHNKNIVISFYGGEPLLNIDLIKSVVGYFKTEKLLHNKVIFSITTNGLLLKSHIDFLVKNQFKILISLDGNHQNNSYRLFTNGTESFSQVLKNVKYIKKFYPDYFETMVNFNSVLHNRNSISDIYSFFKKEIQKLPSISELNTVGIKPNKISEFKSTYQNKNESLSKAHDYITIKKELSNTVGETVDLGIFLLQYSGNLFLDYNEFFIEKNKSFKTPTGTCLPFGKKMFITVNGKILPCEKIGYQYALGKIYNKKVDLSFERIVKKYNSFFARIIKQCYKCFNIDSCIQCIFNFENISTKPKCNGFLNKQQFNKKVTDLISLIEKEPEIYKKILEDLVIDL